MILYYSTSKYMPAENTETSPRNRKWIFFCYLVKSQNCKKEKEEKKVVIAATVKNWAHLKKITQYFWKQQFDAFGNQCDVLRAAFAILAMFLWRGCMIILLLICCVILCVERLHDFLVWRGCVIFLTHSDCMIYFSQSSVILQLFSA